MTAEDKNEATGMPEIKRNRQNQPKGLKAIII